ncbi:hypothetical protein INT43_006051 [Umbelopsis isabellina]|uniref:Uncharacterized protein n=1 Tax=Mortierella isabellina TaxID=91625 RepID=A0A8H7PJ27_MORIS|nr:hypothetical protein INT43_006051 [Umbelopsis isabellina]
MDSVLNWDEVKVCKWLSSVGYTGYEKKFKENGITGDVLVNLDSEALKDLSIQSAGVRTALLKNIYHLKVLYRIPINDWDYIPPTITYENEWLGHNGMLDYRKIEAAFQERDATVRQLTDEISKTINDVARLRDEMMSMWKVIKDKKPLPVPDFEKAKPTNSKYPNPWSPHNLRAMSPYESNQEGWPQSPLEASNSMRRIMHDGATFDEIQRGQQPVTVNDGGAIKVYGGRIANNSKVELEASKNVRLLLDDPCSKVIPVALKKYNVADDWQNYALCIQWGPEDNLQERVLSYEEKPLRVLQKLKESKQNPMFTLKHIKDSKPLTPPGGDSNMAALTSPNLSPPAGMLGRSQSYKAATSMSNPNSFSPSRPVPLKPSSSVSSNLHQHKDLPTSPNDWSVNGTSAAGSASGQSTTQSTLRSLMGPLTKSNKSSSQSQIDASAKSGSGNHLAPKSNLEAPVMAPSISAPTASTSTNTSQAKPEHFLGDLGLESGMADAIYSYMMSRSENNSKDSNGNDSK